MNKATEKKTMNKATQLLKATLPDADDMVRERKRRQAILTTDDRRRLRRHRDIVLLS